ncbi:SDR family oxidoreductase [Saccharopolyspora sp. NFXS83]|uniref:SDR family NAD(P)-dependent oxidoreductase n=1 Tax=Saccharopolyspora sp. NFXS83 TaxID=2993560 RepID=UPI00224AB5F5|nr:SDR family NAD(P)-dependent oxidoreductase [Saccharopolyspora sp. NFXS83]MCX2730180.1 SDR family oxidoreductase [Saccharopolyspora sp. NFXS83]
MPVPLTLESTVAEWLDHPAGGPILRGMLEENGQSPALLTAVRHFSMSRLVEMSGGRIGADELERLAAEANAAAGASPDAPRPTPAPRWQERITQGRFTGGTVIITGAGSGIGRATASRVAREGGRVVAADIAQDRLDALANELEGHEVVPVRADITREDGVAAILAAADGRADALANVAGITDSAVPLHEVDDELWQRVLDVNLTGMFRLTRAVLPLMIEAGRGSIVNITSEAALRGSTAGTAYTASKHAVVGLTRSTAFMYGPSGIRVNAVAPGGVATGIEGGMSSAMGRERLEPLLATLPTIAEPEHIAASVAFLLSDDSVNVNGALLPSDGGWSIQ